MLEGFMRAASGRGLIIDVGKEMLSGRGRQDLTEDEFARRGGNRCG